MNEYITTSEIMARFDSEWILLGDPDTTENLEVLGGKLLWHSKDRDEVYRKAGELGLRRSAFLYTGKILQDGEAIVL